MSLMSQMWWCHQPAGSLALPLCWWRNWRNFCLSLETSGVMLFIKTCKVLHLVNNPNCYRYFFLFCWKAGIPCKSSLTPITIAGNFPLEKKIMVVRGVWNTSYSQIIWDLMIGIRASQRFDFATISFQYFTLFLPLLRVYDTACL